MRASSLFGVILSVVCSSAAVSATVYDNFNLEKWTVLRDGKGLFVHEANERFELLLSPDSMPAVGSDRFRGGYRAKCQLQGDFDVQVSFKLITFPASNGVRFGLAFGDAGNVFAIERANLSEREGFPGGSNVYQGTDPVGTARTGTSDRRGRLRAVREDGRIRGYYFNASANTWEQVGATISQTTSDLSFLLTIWSYDWAFEDTPIKVALDNVVLNSGTLVGTTCPFATGNASERPATE